MQRAGALSSRSFFKTSGSWERLTRELRAGREMAAWAPTRRNNGGNRVSVRVASWEMPSGDPVRPCTSSAACCFTCVKKWRIFLEAAFQEILI
jgi:hypothetical protein